MQVRCTYCERLKVAPRAWAEAPPPAADERVSHGMCEACWNERYAALFGPLYPEDGEGGDDE